VFHTRGPAALKTLSLSSEVAWSARPTNENALFLGVCIRMSADRRRSLYPKPPSHILQLKKRIYAWPWLRSVAIDGELDGPVWLLTF